MAVVVEPIVTREKLLALLAEQSEASNLDYKEMIDLGRGTARDTVELAKDVGAMRAEPAGAYIVVGADDHGAPVGLSRELARHFDEATLRPKLAKYLTEPDVRCAQHDVDGKTLALIYVAPSAFGWCVMRALGEYEEQTANGKSQRTVFRQGDVFVRHGTSSERWTDTDRERLVSQIVARRKDDWRRELAEEFAAQAHLGQAVAGLQNQPSVALTWRLDEETFEQTLTEMIRRDDDIPLRRLLSQMTRDARELFGNDREELRSLLDRLTTFAALAIQFEREAWIRRCVAALERVYELGGRSDQGDPDAVWLWLDIVTKVYALGALAVRHLSWPTVKLLADRRPEINAFSYHGSWLRHAVTMAARAGIFETDEKAGLLARAHNAIRADVALHPDRPSESDAILNSLCQFDVYSALVVIGERGTLSTGNFYTNFARYYSQRSAPAFEAVVGVPAVRQALFDGSDQLLADAIASLSSHAWQEGIRFGGWDGLDSPIIQQFIAENGSPQD